MSLLDILRKRKKADKKPLAPKPVEKKTEEKKEAPAAVKIEPQKMKKKTPGMAFGVLRHPHITEKATFLGQTGRYVFKIRDRANKNEVRKTIEDMYGVDVAAVKVINVPAKKRRRGRKIGWIGSYKKAIVEVKKGQKIDILPR